MRITMKLQHASGPTGEAQRGLHEYDDKMYADKGLGL